MIHVRDLVSQVISWKGRDNITGVAKLPILQLLANGVDMIKRGGGGGGEYNLGVHLPTQVISKYRLNSRRSEVQKYQVVSVNLPTDRQQVAPSCSS